MRILFELPKNGKMSIENLPCDSWFIVEEIHGMLYLKLRNNVIMQFSKYLKPEFGSFVIKDGYTDGLTQQTLVTRVTIDEISIKIGANNVYSI